MMKAKRWIVIGTVASAAAVLTVLAVPSATRTFRTTASVGSVFQIPNPLNTNVAALVNETFAGHDLVNLALGTALTTVRTNEVLALEIACGSGSADLVVFNRTLASNTVVIAKSSQITALTGQDNPSAAGPNHERFVIKMDVNTNNFLIGGFLTVAGRVFLDTNGCPRAVLVDTDRRNDKGFADAVVKNLDDKTDKDKRISGEAHLIGVANIVFQDGSTNTVLLPFGQFTMRRQLLP
jgi:hypothetical protein